MTMYSEFQLCSLSNSEVLINFGLVKWVGAWKAGTKDNPKWCAELHYLDRTSLCIDDTFDSVEEMISRSEAAIATHFGAIS